MIIKTAHIPVKTLLLRKPSLLITNNCLKQKRTCLIRSIIHLKLSNILLSLIMLVKAQTRPHRWTVMHNVQRNALCVKSPYTSFLQILRIDLSRVRCRRGLTNRLRFSQGLYKPLTYGRFRVQHDPCKPFKNA